MNVIVLSASPNKDGLTAACAVAAIDGARQAGGQAEEVRLNDLDIGLCRACGSGYGPCQSDHEWRQREPLIRQAGDCGGGGMITCLLSMERWIQHVRARVFDLLPVNRWSREYKPVAIREAARAMVQQAKEK